MIYWNYWIKETLNLEPTTQKIFHLHGQGEEKKDGEEEQEEKEEKKEEGDDIDNYNDNYEDDKEDTYLKFTPRMLSPFPSTLEDSADETGPFWCPLWQPWKLFSFNNDR